MAVQCYINVCLLLLLPRFQGRTDRGVSQTDSGERREELIFDYRLIHWLARSDLEKAPVVESGIRRAEVVEERHYSQADGTHGDVVIVL
jgi:hypothetical protein